jgi:hypothetical protein
MPGSAVECAKAKRPTVEENPFKLADAKPSDSGGDVRLHLGIVLGCGFLGGMLGFLWLLSTFVRDHMSPKYFVNLLQSGLVGACIGCLVGALLCKFAPAARAKSQQSGPRCHRSLAKNKQNSQRLQT